MTEPTLESARALAAEARKCADVLEEQVDFGSRLDERVVYDLRALADALELACAASSTSLQR